MSCTPRDLPAEVHKVRQKIYSLRQSPSGQGLNCLCNDGVLRSFSSSKTVVDALPLSEDEIRHMCLLYPDEDQEQAAAVFRGVDGHRVPQEKLFAPDEEVLPENLRGGGRLG